MPELAGKHAAVIGIDAYGQGVAALRTAVADARALAAALRQDHGYRDPFELLDREATRAGIDCLLEERLPAAVEPDSGLVLYFAGHGVALNDDDGPRGYLIPQDARTGEPETWLPMDRVRTALARLPCRHLLVVLDCCFAGSFRWAASRKILLPAQRPLYDSQYARFLDGRAWQVLTSASHQEEAQDVVPGRRNTRDRGGAEHSPFAAALLEGLAGGADSSRGSYAADGVVTATELYQYVFEELVPAGKMRRQTPGLWPLEPDNAGEFIFLSPRQERATRPDPPLDDANNPWLGLEAYRSRDAPLFFGRELVVKELLVRLNDLAAPPLLAVVGASGNGKSSVIRAGVLPRLELEDRGAGAPEWTVVHMPRLEGDPRRQLEAVELRLAAAPERPWKLLFVDQLEELYTQCPDRSSRAAFRQRLRQLMTGSPPVRVLVTLRSDFEPRLKTSRALADLLAAGRYPMPAPTSEELRQIVEQPALLKALYFEPPELVGELADEVVAMPGGLPLLSFALAEMYRQARLRRRESGALDRALTRQDYEEVGGVAGALHQRANRLMEAAERRDTVASVRRVALRMVSLQGGRVVRRRIHRRELVYAGREEQATVKRIIRKLTEARLVVADQDYLEPAHETLVQAWSQSTAWLASATGTIPLLRAVWPQARAWERRGRPAGLLWNEDPRLPRVEKMGKELNLLEKQFLDASVGRRQRRRWAVAAIVAAVMALLAGAAVYSDSKRVQAENRELVMRARSHQHDRLDLALLLSLEVERRGDAFAARRLLFEGLESSPRLERLLHGHAGEVLAVAWSGDGRWLASAAGDSVIWLWDAFAGRPVVSLRAGGEVSSLAWSAGSHRLAAGTRAGVVVWETADLDSGPRRLGAGAASYAVAFSPDGRRLAATRNDDSVRILEVEPGSDGHLTLTGARDWLPTVVWSPDGRTVAAAGMDQVIRQWDANTGEEKGMPIWRHTEGVMSLAWSADGRFLASGSLDGTVMLWEPATGERQGPPLDSMIGPVGSVAWNGDSRTLAVGGIDGRVVLWDVAEWRPRALPATGQTAALRSVAWSGDGHTLASGNGSAVVLWSTGPGSRLGRRVELDAYDVSPVATSRDRATVVAEGRDRDSQKLTFRLWDATSGESRGVLAGDLRRETAAVALSADGLTLAAAGLDGTVRRWEIATGRVLGEARLDGAGRLARLTWSAGGSRLAAGNREGTVSLWDGATGRPLGPSQTGHDGRVTRLSFSPDGRTVASGGYDGAVRLWDAASGRPRAIPLAGHDGPVTSLVWSGDGRRLASGSRDLTILIWDVAAGGRDEAPLRAHTAAVTGLAWSGDGRTLASASNDGDILLWDVGERVIVAGPLAGHRDTVTGLFFHPDGMLLSIHMDGTLMLWDVDPDSWRARACRIANRNLSPEEWRRFLRPYPYRRTCPNLPRCES